MGNSSVSNTSTLDPSSALLEGRATDSRGLLIISLCLGLSILYQVYFFEFKDGELTGGGAQRLLLKAVAALLMLVSVRDYLSLYAVSLNLFLKLPLFFVAATILVIAPFLIGDYLQALNLFFFMPVLLIDWNKPGGASLYRTIWAIITLVVAVQLVLDPFCKFYFQVAWSNGALIGGMGNPNIFGIFLITSGLACALLLQSGFKFLSSLLFLATPLTGSLVSSISGFACLFIQLVLLVCRSPARALPIFGAVVVVVCLSTLTTEFITDTASIEHAFNKLLGLWQLLNGGGSSTSQSISIRGEYLQHGLEMLADSPLSIIVGHPNATPMYNGDGLWTSFVVTYGLPITLYFLAVNLFVIYRGVISGSRDLLFSACVVAIALLFFVANRILDYWPAALVYLLAFSYLTNKGVRRAPPALSQP